MKPFTIGPATEAHLPYVQDVVNALLQASKAKGTGLAKRSPEYITAKIQQGRRSSPCTKTASRASATWNRGSTSATWPPRALL